MAQLVSRWSGLTDCRWWFESLLAHSEVSSATRRKATGADKKNKKPDETVRFVLCPFLGLEKVHTCRIWTLKGGPPSSAHRCLCHPSSLLWFHCFWWTFEVARGIPSVMSQPQKQDCHIQRVDFAPVAPAIKIKMENSFGMALPKVKSGSAWQSHFDSWKLELLKIRSSSQDASGSKLGFVWAASFQRNWGGSSLGVQKANLFTALKMRLL